MNLSKQKFKHISLVIFLIICPLLIGCEQPPSGELEPIAVDGATLTTSRFENDTLLFSENGLNVKFYGTWKGSIGLRIAIQNTTDNDLIVRFDEMYIENSKGERAVIGDITERQKGNFIYLRRFLIGNEENTEKAPQVKIYAGTQRKFLMAFTDVLSSSKTDKENLLYITLPVEIEGNPKTVKNYKLVFKKIERKTNDMSDPEAW